MTKEESIKDTLELIRRALEDDNTKNINDNILILNRKVNNDGTINIIKKDQTDIDEIEKTLPVGWAHGDRYSDIQWIGPERYC